MSKYDEENFIAYKEKQNRNLPELTRHIEDDEILLQLNKLPISSVNKMIYSNDLNLQYHEYINNNQKRINKDYFTNCKLFSQCEKAPQKVIYLLDMLRKECIGGIVNSKLFKEFIDNYLNDQSLDLSIGDYERLFMLNLCKDNINLNNQNDYSLFYELLINLLSPIK